MDRVNLKKLAEELNLSVSTVSRALSDSYEIGSETKEKVLALAKKLNYQPNPFASSLRKQKSKTIAVVIPEIANNFFTLAINGIEKVAQEKGYHVLIYLTHEDHLKEVSIAQYLINGRVDGVLMSVSGETNDISHIENLTKKNIPTVFFDRVCEKINAPKITTDDYESGYKAAGHLIERKCKRIAYLSASKSWSINKKRLQGYLDALKVNSIQEDSSLITDCSNNDADNYKIITELLSLPNRPDGIFASIERLAITSYEVCRQLHLAIPQDVKIVSFSNLQTASLLNPSLTTITQPAFEMGEEAARALFSILAKKALQEDENIIIPSTLMERDSTAPKLSS